MSSLLDTNQLFGVWLSFGGYMAIMWQAITVLLMISLAALVLGYKPSSSKARSSFGQFAHSETLFLLISVLTIILVRSPTWMMGIGNIDEAQWLAGAITLEKDYSFWGSVDGTTSGPLVIHALYLWNALFGIAGFHSAKVFTTLIWIGITLFTYFSLKQITDLRAARVFVCPLIGLVALMHAPEFVSYNSEQIPILLLSLSAFILCRIYTADQPSHWDALVLGIALGALPYTKLQAVPIGLLFGLFGMLLYYRKRAMFTLLLTVLALNGIILGYLAVNNLLADFWISYILENFEYAQSFSGLPFIKRPYGFLRIWLTLEEGRSFVILSSMAIGASGLLWFWRSSRQARKSDYLVWGVLGYLATAAYCVWQPGTFFGHYYLFMFHPILLTTAILVSRCKTVVSSKSANRVNITVVGLLFLGVSLPVILTYSAFISELSSIAPAKAGIVSVRLRELANEKTRLSVWGWAPHYHVESSLPQATTEAHTYRQITPGKYQVYFLQRYLAQLQEKPDLLFVDATNSTESKYFRDPEFGHENYLEVSRFVGENLEYVESINGARIYRSVSK